MSHAVATRTAPPSTLSVAVNSADNCLYQPYTLVTSLTLTEATVREFTSNNCFLIEFYTVDLSENSRVLYPREGDVSMIWDKRLRRKSSRTTSSRAS